MQSNLAIWDFAVWDTCLRGTDFLGTAELALQKPRLCGTPGYVGQLGWAIECPIYPGSTVAQLNMLVQLGTVLCCTKLKVKHKKYQYKIHSGSFLFTKLL